MSTAAELFVITLARASRKAGLYLNRMSRHDREDVLQGAIAWCWENRENYDPKLSLDEWFLNAVRDAKKLWTRHERRRGSADLDNLISPDEPSVQAEAAQARELILKRVAAMPEMHRAIADLQLQQFTRDEIADTLKVDHNAISEVRKKLAPMQRHIPDSRTLRRVIRGKSFHGEHQGAPSGIDHAIAQIDFPPPSGKDCRPCWRCKWFEGYLPRGHLDHKMEIAEPDVRKAVSDTEARKIEIAKRIKGEG